MVSSSVVGRRPGTIEDAVAGGLQQDDTVVLAELGEALDRAFLRGETGRAGLLGLEPVEVVGEVDHRIGAGVVEQLGQAGGIPALFGRARGEEPYIILGPQADKRLAKGIATAQEHQAHTHRQKVA